MRLKFCILDSCITQVQSDQTLIPSNTHETKIYWAHLIPRILIGVKWHQNVGHDQYHETISEDAPAKYLLDDLIVSSANLKVNLVSEG